MGDYGNEFINVNPPSGNVFMHPLAAEAIFPTPTDDAAWSALATAAIDNAKGLQGAIEQVSGLGGGVVFIPPGRYYVGRNLTVSFDRRFVLDVPDVFVHSNVTLSFAPGAVLVPMNFAMARGVNGMSTAVPMPESPDEDYLVRIEIQGEIDAEVRPIFDVFLEPDNPADAGFRPRTSAGLILITSTRIREVRPEWWGARTGGPIASNPAAPEMNLNQQKSALYTTAALQAAIDAAHTHRRRPMRSRISLVLNEVMRDGDAVLWWHLPSIPVVVQNVCTIMKPLRVGLTRELPDGGVVAEVFEPNPAPFVLLGEREVGGSGSGGTTLLVGDVSWPTIGDFAMLDIRGISSFVLRNMCFDGGHTTSTVLRFEAGPDNGHCEVSNSVFYSLRNTDGAALIRMLTATPVAGAAPLQGIVNVAFTRCRLEPNSVAASGTTFPAPGINGVEINVDDRVNLEFRTCFMTTPADPMINARRGHFSLNECAFHTGRVRRDRRVDRDSIPYLNNANGTDVFIQAPRSVNGNPDAPASFTARETESQSYQFLATFSDSDLGLNVMLGSQPSGSRSACVFMNAHHVCVPQLPVDAGRLNHKDFRPSIYWAGPTERGSHLISIGCRWSSRYLPSPDSDTDSGLRGGIRVANNQMGRIYHLGNITNNLGTGDFASGPMGIRPEGVIVAEPPAELMRIHTLSLRSMTMM